MKVLHFVRHRLLGGHLEFRVRLFNVLAMGGTLISLLMGMLAIVINAGLINAIVNFATAILSFALLRYSYRTGRYQICYMITIIGIFICLFPIMFFSAGGYHSGMPSFFVFAVVFTVFMLEGKKAIFFSAFEILFYTALCAAAFYRPEWVSAFANEQEVLLDIIIAFVTVSIILSICLYIHFHLYNRQQRELEAARKQAEEYAEMKSELFANMSHEMRTPLTVMSGYAQYAVKQIMKTGANDQTLADLATIGDEAKRLAEMADGTLKILISPSDSGEDKAVPVDIGDLTGRIARLFGSVASRKGRKITADIKENLPFIHGDTDALTQLLWNILQNAVTHAKSTVALSAGKDGQRIKITIKDDGEGIPPDILPHIFERGFSGREGGSGIGLAISREIARRHGGDIACESGTGTGTRVTITLPIAERADANA